jgi:hypothetical protein
MEWNERKGKRESEKERQGEKEREGGREGERGELLKKKKKKGSCNSGKRPMEDGRVAASRCFGRTRTRGPGPGPCNAHGYPHATRQRCRFKNPPALTLSLPTNKTQRNHEGSMNKTQNTKHKPSQKSSSQNKTQKTTKDMAK